MMWICNFKWRQDEVTRSDKAHHCTKKKEIRMTVITISGKTVL